MRDQANRKGPVVSVTCLSFVRGRSGLRIGCAMLF